MQQSTVAIIFGCGVMFAIANADIPYPKWGSGAYPSSPYYPYPYAYPSPASIPASAPAPYSYPSVYPAYPSPASIPASAPAPYSYPSVYPSPAAIPAPAPAPSYKYENFATPFLAKSEIRDDAGQYSLSYNTANGIRVNERGFLKPSTDPEGDYVLAKEGSYSYTSPEGIPVHFAYTADENGFITKGFPLPISPAQPPVAPLA